MYIDPLMSQAITYMLIEQPSSDAILDTVLSYFKALSSGSPPRPKSALQQNRKVKSTDRLYMAKAMSPVFTKLINCLLALRPDSSEVLPFIIKTLEGMITEAAASAEAEAAAEPEPAVDVKMPSKMTVLCIGIDNSGKTTFMQTIQGNPSPKTKPTGGFESHLLQLGESKVSFYDLAGQERYRDWESYYHDCHGVVYLLDAAADDMKYEESCKVLLETVENDYLKGKPTVLFLNKMDLPAARGVDEIVEEICWGKGKHVKVSGVVMHPQRTSEVGTPDKRIDECLEWLFNKIAKEYDMIEARLKADMEAEKLKQAKLKEENDRRILKDSICKAFGVNGEEAGQDVFDVDGGEEFLAQEIGFMTKDELEQEGKDIAKLVGYQKLAMRLVAGKFAPWKKGERKWTWGEIKEYVLEIKAEVGL